MIEFVEQGIGQAEIELLIGGDAVLAHADLRERCDFTGEFFSLLTGCTLGDNTIDQTHAQSFSSIDGTTCEDQVESPAETDQSG